MKMPDMVLTYAANATNQKKQVRNKNDIIKHVLKEDISTVNKYKRSVQLCHSSGNNLNSTNDFHFKLY